MKITLDMKISHYPSDWTLAEAVEDLKREKLTRLLENTDEEISEHVLLFKRSVYNGESPTIGQVWAAWFVASIEALDDECYAEGSTMTPRQYGARKAAITRLVFRKEY